MSIDLPSSWGGLSAVLAHDWLTGMRGGEKCLEFLCDGFPQAPIYTLVYEEDQVSESIRRHPVVPSALQHPLLRRKFRAALPFFPRLAERWRPPEADLLISTSHCVAKGIQPAGDTRHLCYCFTPMRYGFFYHDYFGRNPLKELAIRPLLARLRAWDVKASSRVHRFVAISEHVRRRIQYIYGRDADVVYPPVDTDRFTPGAREGGDYDLVVSALVPYKRIHLAVKAYTQLGLPLRVVGTGSETARLKSLAGPTIEFTGWQSDDQILEHYRGCRFLLFPGEEDFGIVPLEAQACGKPVIAFGRGGAEETIRHGETGYFFRQCRVPDLVEAVEAAARIDWNPETIRAHALHFHPQRFLDGLDRSIHKCLNEKAL